MKKMIIDKGSFGRIKQQMNEFDSKREYIIKESRVILKNSKKAIYSTHRDDIKQAEKLLQNSETIKKKIDLMLKKDHLLGAVGAFDEAIQEYVEAVSYLSFMKKTAIGSPEKLNVKIENYLGGVCDLTGELVRKAINSSIKSEYDITVEIKDFVEQLYAQLIELDFRSGLLRKKFDSVKYDLNKLEDLIFELKKLGKIK